MNIQYCHFSPQFYTQLFKTQVCLCVSCDLRLDKDQQTKTLFLKKKEMSFLSQKKEYKMYFFLRKKNIKAILTIKEIYAREIF